MRFLLLILVFLIITNCSFLQTNDKLETHSIKSFYFPYEKMYDTLVYHYKSDTDVSMDIYWVMYTYNDKKDTLFHSYNFSTGGEAFLMIEHMIEKITSEGAFLKEYRSIFVNPFSESDVLKTKIIKNEIFRWQMKTGDSLYFEFLEKDTETFNGKRRVGKTRTLITPADSITTFHVNVKGEKVQAAKFTDKFIFKFENSDKKQKQTTDFSRNSWYAEKIGLVKFDQEIESKTHTIKLAKIIPFQKWEMREQLRVIMNEK